MPMSTIWRAVLAAGIVSTLSACMDLDIENPNEPDRERALSNPGDLEALIQSQFEVFWTVQQGNAPGPALDAMAEVESLTSANYGFQDQGMIPPQPIVNQVGYNWGYWVRDPFQNQYRALAAIRDVLLSIRDLGIQLPSGARVNAIAKFLQGVFHANIALQYDRGFILDETVERPGALELRPYGEVMEAARRYLAEARAIAAAESFTIPEGWLGPASMSRERFIQVAHSYEARFMAQVARSPEERAQVDWNEVLDHIENGIREDFGVELDGPGGRWNAPYKGRSSLNANVAPAFIGPADQSGAYQRWESLPPSERAPFLIDTDDRRITDGTPTGPGKYVVYRDYTVGAPERGLWYLSYYARRWWPQIGDTGFGFAPDITVQEMNFLRAEAYMRLGQPELALPIINEARTQIGELPPATLEGATGERCVPRSVGLLAKASSRPEGECGDLWQVLIYEKRMQLAFLSQGNAYYDARGFGTLRTGRAIHAPVPMEELQLLGISHYTFGGVGGPGSAP